MPNYTLYETLGLKKENNPSQVEIKKAYRQMALKWHPDRFDRGNYHAKTKQEAEEKFKEINNAYEVLSDPAKKREYDLYGDKKEDNSYSYSSSSDYDKWKKEDDDYWNKFWKDQKRKNKEWKNKKLKEWQDDAIDYLENELLRKNVSAQKLNAQLGVSDWKTKITEITDKWKVDDKKWHISDTIDLLSREFTCKTCKKTRNDLFCPWELDGEKFCDWDCKETYVREKTKMTSKNYNKKLIKEIIGGAVILLTLVFIQIVVVVSKKKKKKSNSKNFFY